MTTYLLSALQQRLQSLYEITIPFDVNQFLITDPVLVRCYEGDGPTRDIQEKLLLYQEDDTLDLALYLDQHLLDVLVAHSPWQSLDHRNLDAFLTVLEGVSHFLYASWNALHDRTFSLFELELQAEVDKFVILLTLLCEQRNRDALLSLHHRLFTQVRYSYTLDSFERDRYQKANDYAARFCQEVEPKYFGNQLFRNLRRFYRFTQAQKLAYILTDRKKYPFCY